MPILNMTNNYQSSKYIVDADESTPYATIQSAIDQVIVDYGGAPIFGVTINIRPGEYIEDLVLYDNVFFVAVAEGQIVIQGTHTPPVSGALYFEGIKFVSATDTFVDAVNIGTTSIKLYNCTFSNNLGYVLVLPFYTGDIIIESCDDISASNALVFNSAGASVDILESNIGTGASHIIVSGPTRIFNSTIGTSIDFTLTASARLDNSRFLDTLYSLNDAQVQIYNSYISSSAECYATTSTQQTIISNVTMHSPAPVPDVITGTGSIEIGQAVFLDVDSIAGTLTVDRVNVCLVGNLTSRGVINLPATEDTGSGGIINFDSDHFIHAMGTRNTFMGQEAGNLLLTVPNATDNIGQGHEVLHDLTTADKVCAGGSYSCTHLTTGAENTAYGYNTLSALLTGEKNIAIGSNSGSSYVAAESSNILIGNTGVVAESNTVRIGVDGAGAGQQNANYQAGIYQAPSGATKEVVWIDSDFKLSSSNCSITSWVIATADLIASANVGYFIDIAIPGPLTLTLPAGSVLGDTIEITGFSAGMWTLAQSAADIIYTTGNATTLGVAGSVGATNRYDSIKIVCYGDMGGQTVWKVISSIGVLNFI